MGQRHPEGKQLLLSPPVLPVLLPPYLLLFVLAAVVILRFTTVKPLLHFDQEVRPGWELSEETLVDSELSYACLEGKAAVMSLPGLPSDGVCVFGGGGCCSLCVIKP